MADRSTTRTTAAKKKTKSDARARPDKGDPIDGYFEAIEDPKLRASAERLRELVGTAVPKAEAAIKWGRPTWLDPIFLCSVAAFKKHVSIQFFDAGTSLDDPKGLLEGTGKACRHVKSRSPDDIDAKAVTSLIKQAHAFNKTAGGC